MLYKLRDKRKETCEEHLTCRILNLLCKVSSSLWKHKSLYKLGKKNAYSTNSTSASVEVIYPPLERIHIWEASNFQIPFLESLGQEERSVFPRVKLPDYRKRVTGTEILLGHWRKHPLQKWPQQSSCSIVSCRRVFSQPHVITLGQVVVWSQSWEQDLAHLLH